MMRRAFLPFVFLVVLAQAAALLALPAVSVLYAAADQDGMICTCTHGANETCPMHHGPAKSDQPNSQDGTAPARWCRGCLDGSEAALAFVALWDVPLADLVEPSRPDGQDRLNARALTAFPDRIAVPLTPPPRA